MKFLFAFLLVPLFCFGQLSSKYEPTALNPYGLPNPDAPKEILDFDPLIGTCDCISTARNADQSWGDSQKMTWTFKYIMNGMGIQDETLKEDGSHSGSIRQFIADSSKWYVHWYSNTTPSTTLPTWQGGKRGDSIVLYREQKAPNGMDGSYRLTFSNISEKGFHWIGEWVDTTGKFVFPTWKIKCVKRDSNWDKEIILKNVAAFSKAYMGGNIEKLSRFYTEDGKIFPNNTDIISGRDAIKKRWTLPEDVSIKYHKVTPLEIKIIGDFAYDYGYYEGSSVSQKGESPFKGKYVIVWKKIDGDWKMYLDIWNNI